MDSEGEIPLTSERKADQLETEDPREKINGMRLTKESILRHLRKT